MRASVHTLLSITLVGLTGCATVPGDGAERQVRERADTQTGSNLPRRGGSGTGAVEIDKNSVEDSIGGATRSTGK